jgi:hypothetical protein
MICLRVTQSYAIDAKRRQAEAVGQTRESGLFRDVLTPSFSRADTVHDSSGNNNNLLNFLARTPGR